MKKIITLISVLLICITTFGQFPQNPTQGQTQIKQTNLGAIEAQRGLKAGQFVDTSAANAVLYMKGVAGILIYTTSDNNYWYRSADTTRWVLIATTTSNCAGTQLISGSITWSGSGLVYDATDLDYYILCSRYFANSTTLTLAVADPTNPRIDKFYADNTGNIGVITGTPSANPQEPAINPLSQLDMGFVYIPAGSTVPAGTTQTVIYNENVEWSGTSDVPSVNFDYATNPYIGTVSTYLPNAPYSSYVEWQSNGIDYLFSEAQYLKFWVRLNANFTVDPLSFLDVTFEYTDVTVSQTLAVGDGDYNMDYSLINQWQLVSIPLTGITTYGTDFNSVHFVINSAPTSFQLDYVYLLETATVPPVISSGWSLNLNTGTNPTTNGIGTSDSVGVAIKTNSQTRLIFPANGIVELSNDDLSQKLLTIKNDTIYKTNIPTAYGTLPIVVEVRNDSTFITCPTCDTIGGSGWSLTGNAGTNVFTNFIGTTDDVGLRFKVNNNNAGYIDNVNYSTSFGLEALNGSPSGDFNNAFGYTALFSLTTGTENNAFGHTSLYSNQTGNSNNAFGYSSLYVNTGSENNAFGYRALAQSVSGTMNTAMGDSALITLTTGSRNTAIGANADVATSSTDSAVAIGYQASASTKQLAFSPYLNTMFLNLDSASGTAPAIAGIDENGNWRKYATPSGGGEDLNATVALGNTVTDNNIIIEGDGYEFISRAASGSVQSTIGNDGLTGSGYLSLTNENGFTSTLRASLLTSDKLFELPTSSGTLALENSNTTGTAAGLSATLVSGSGGTGFSTYTTGDLIYASATNTLSKLGIGTAAQSLKVVGGIPAWRDTLAVSGVYATLTGSETLTNKTITSPTLSGTLIGSGTIGGFNTINIAGNITGFNIVATGLIRSAAASNIEHNGRNKFNATSDGFETLTANSGTANTANLSVGSLRTGYVAKTANYTATAFDETISCSTNAFTITLPTAVGCAGQKYNITNSTAANTIGISTTSSQTFANVVATPTSINLVGLGAVTVVSDGANWLQLH